MSERTMQGRYEWRGTRCYVGLKLIGSTNAADGGEFVARNERTEIIDRFKSRIKARRAVESAFEAWREKIGLVWKDPLTSEKEA